MARELRVAYLNGLRFPVAVAACFKLKLPRRGSQFFPVTFADGGRGFLTTEGLISARVTDTLSEEDGA